MEINKLYLGDCLTGLKELPDKCVDLVLTDPPYEGHYDWEDNPESEWLNKRGLDNQKDILNFDSGFDFKILDELCRVMKKINIYLFCSKSQIIPYLDYFVKDRGCLWEPLRWIKTNPIPACNNKFLSDTEYILFFREPGVKMYGNWKNRSTYYLQPINNKDKALYGHPTIKPLNILRNLIINSSQENDLVLDCFAGSGSTLVAAKELGRSYIGYEIDETYYKTASDRLDKTNRSTDLALF